MNKTININLGGFFFHIDETAYQKLKRYLDAIARSLSDDPQGKNEIISDIEARISELLSERITDARQVVNEADIEEIINIMGQPEDYSETEENYSQSSNYYNNRRNTSSKKLFRDGDDKFLGGVAAGLAHYVNIDIIWVRLTFLILTLAGIGFGVIAYIILWILLPEAKTTSEKLQMEGEAVNIDNIEKKIRNEFDNLSSKVKEGAHELSDKISSADYQKLKNQTKSGLQDFLDTLGKILLAVFKVFGKFMGVLLLFIAGIVLISLFFGLFSVGSLEIIGFDNEMVHYPPFFYDSILPKWLLATTLFLAIGIPFVALFILGLRILSPNIKKLGTPTALTLTGIWLISIFCLVFSGIEFATSKAYKGTKVVKQAITYNTETPLKIRVINNDDIHYRHSLRRRSNAVDVIVNDEKMKYSNDFRIDVEKSETGNAYIEIKKRSEGRNRKKANNQASEIIYNYKIANNTIVFDGYFLSKYKSLWKDEEVTATIYIPEETKIFFENSSKSFLYSIKNTQDIYDRDMVNHNFKMTSKGFECIDCENENINSDEENINDNNNKDISFLFDSTINNIKAELIITKETTKNELEQLARWFKNKKNIDIDFSKSTFYNNGKIKTYNLNVNCNDGYKGKTTTKTITINNGKHGFIRNYDDENVSFKIW